MVRGLRVVFLPEADAGQFKRKSLVAGLLAKPDLKGPLGFIPSPQAGQRRSVVVIEIGGALDFNLRDSNDLLPPFFREELLDFCGVIGDSGLRPEGKRGKGEDKKYSRRWRLPPKKRVESSPQAAGVEQPKGWTPCAFHLASG